jgi:hypothetical protein
MILDIRSYPKMISRILSAGTQNATCSKMGEDKMRNWLIIVALILLLGGSLVACTLTISAPTLPVPTLVPRPPQPPGDQPLQVVVYCSQERLRTGIARVSWQALPAEAEAQKLEVTIFKRGFELGAFSTFSPLSDKQLRFPRLPEGDQITTGGLKRLELTSMDYNQEKNNLTVEMGNLEPGLLYLLRLRTGSDKVSKIVSVEAPVCVADIEGE